MAKFTDLQDMILVRIMGHLWRFLDIVAFTHACRATRYAFERNEGRVLWDFLLRFYGINLYEAIHLAPYALEFDANVDYRFADDQAAGEVRESSWSRKVREWSLEFLRPSFTERSRIIDAWIVTDYHQHTIVRLCRLSTVLDGLLGQYWEFVQGVVRDQVPTLCGGHSAGLPEAFHALRPGLFVEPPSSNERHRLLRAFLRYEIMCRLFCIPYWKTLVCMSWTGLDLAGKTAALADYAQHDWKSDQFMRLLPRGEAEQVLAVAAFVRAQWRGMLMELRCTFEANAHTRCADFASRAQTAQAEEDDVAPLKEHLSTTIKVQDKESPVYSLEYMLGRPARGDNIWIDNLAAGFGLGLLRKSLQANSLGQRKALRAIISACHSAAQTMDRASGFRPDFIHTRSFPILPHDDLESTYDKAKIRLVGYHLWDMCRLESPEIERLKEWLETPSVPPFEPGSQEQNTPWEAFTSLELPFADYHKLAAHAWVEKFSDVGDVSPERYGKVVSVIRSARVSHILDEEPFDPPPEVEITSEPSEAPNEELEPLAEAEMASELAETLTEEPLDPLPDTEMMSEPAEAPHEEPLAPRPMSESSSLTPPPTSESALSSPPDSPIDY